MAQRARTLAIDIGGTGLKALILDHAGAPLTDRAREETPKPSTPEAVLEVLERVAAPLGAYDRVSVGFPGVVVDGVTHSAPNLGAEWKGFPLVDTLKRRFGKPVRALNDAGVQGFGIVGGKGTELVLTLGTGMGFALFVDGRYVPNLELAHHPFRKGKTYEEYIGAKALEEVGKKTWNRRVGRVIAQIQPVFNPTTVYLGGGNAKKLTIELPANVKIADNVAGLLGGIALWRDS